MLYMVVYSRRPNSERVDAGHPPTLCYIGMQVGLAIGSGDLGMTVKGDSYGKNIQSNRCSGRGSSLSIDNEPWIGCADHQGQSGTSASKIGGSSTVDRTRGLHPIRPESN